MCGLHGLDLSKNKQASKQAKIINLILAYNNEGRGDDSWGLWNPGLGIVKGIGGITKSIRKADWITKGFFHTRKATTGAISVKNAHPFEVGDIIGAHNGMIMNHSELNTKYKRDFECDSVHLFGHLNEGLPFDDLYGYGAIQWVDKKDPKTIFLCKLKGGELSVRGLGTTAKDCNGVVWSSNGEHLKDALRCAGLKSFEFAIQEGQVYSVEKGDLYIRKGRTLSLGTYQQQMPDWRQGRNWTDMADVYDFNSKKNDTTSLVDLEEMSQSSLQLWENEEAIRQQMENDATGGLSLDLEPEDTEEIEAEEEFIPGIGWATLNAAGDVLFTREDK